MNAGERRDFLCLKNLLAIGIATVVLFTSSARGQASPQASSTPATQTSIDQDVDLMRKRYPFAEKADYC